MHLQATPLAATLDTYLQRARDHTLDVFDLEDLFDACANRKTPVALLIDDFDALLKNTSFWPPDNFLHVVRALGQRYPRGLAFVLATPWPLLDLWDPGRGASPYYNIFTTLPAGRLQDQDITSFVQQALTTAKLTADAAEVIELVRAAADYHPYLAHYVTWLCIEELRAGHKPEPAGIAEKFRDADGPVVWLVRQIRAALTPSERQLLETLHTNPAQLTPPQKNTLRRLKGYGLLPPGTRI